MTTLNNLKNTTKKVKAKKCLGRGPGSGRGKTCGRGHKGYGSRKGSRKRYGYEGGQMRLFSKLPRKGFQRKRFCKEKIFCLNLSTISKFYNDNENVNLKTLLEKRIIRKNNINKLKILAKGSLDKKVIIEAHSFSKNALKHLEDKKITYKQIK